MADVEQRAEAEAAQKGLSGGAARAYVGGVFNRIRQAHSRGTQPGKGARHLQRRARVEARQEARNRIARHEQLAAQEKLRMRMRTRQEEPRKGAQTKQETKRPTIASMLDQQERRAREERIASQVAAFERHGTPWATPAPTPAQPAATGAAKAKPAQKLRPGGSKPRKPLVPIKQIQNFQLSATRELDPYWIREYFGDAQLPTALEIQTEKNLSEGVSVVEKKTGKQYTGSRRDREAMYHWILANMNAQSAPTPAQPAATGKARKGKRG